MNTQRPKAYIFPFKSSQFMKGIRTNTNCSLPEKENEDMIAANRVQTLSQVNSNRLSLTDRNNFLSSLVNKIRSVQRVNSCENLRLRVVESTKPQLRIDKIINKRSMLEQTLEFSKHVKRMANGKVSAIRRQQRQSITKIYNEYDLQQSINKMKDQNVNLKNSLKLLSNALEQEKQKYKILQKQMEMKNIIIANIKNEMKIEKISSQTQIKQLKQSIEILKNQCSQLQIQINNSPNLGYCTITATLNEIVFPTPNQDRIKADLIIKQLKADLLNNQKKNIITLTHLRKIKDDEIQMLRRNFFKNLNHYKQIIVKCTSRTQRDPIKFKDDYLEQTILQTNNSQDQS